MRTHAPGDSLRPSALAGVLIVTAALLIVLIAVVWPVLRAFNP